MFFNNLKFYQNSEKIFIRCFLILFILQFLFWLKTENIKPDVNIVPPLPSKHSIAALSLGDDQFYFRVLAMQIQNAGDSFGRFTALKNYDYSKLYSWFKILDSLDDKSRFVPTMASYYYSQTQNIEDNIYIVNYLDEYASRDIDKNWWWMFQAVTIAESYLKNHELALNLAYKLSANNAKEAPLWTKQMPAFIHARMGEDCAAFAVIEKILKDDESGVRKIKPEEMDFMNHFIKDRLGKLKKNKFNPLKCRN